MVAASGVESATAALEFCKDYQVQEFYRVLPSFTEFYRVVPIYTGSQVQNFTEIFSPGFSHFFYLF